MTTAHILNAERVLIYGLEAGGKSECWIDLLLNLPDKPKFYVIDTDGSAKYSVIDMASYMNLSDEETSALLARCRIWQCDDPDGALIDASGKVTYHETQWEAIEKATEAIRRARPKPGSWIIVDRIDAAFEAVQGWWIAKAYKDDYSNYWASLKAEQEQADKGTARDYGGFLGSRDWLPIKRSYSRTVRALLTAPQVHKVAVALAKPPFAQSAKAEAQKEQYGDLMPAGEGNQGADFWTIVQVGRKSDGSHNLWVRRTKRRGGIGEVAANGNPQPVSITNTDGMPAFYSQWFVPYFVGGE